MALKDLLEAYEVKAGDTTLTAEVDYQEGISFILMLWPQKAVQQALKESKRTKWKNHKQVEETDDEAFRQRLARQVLGWKGVNPTALAGLGLITLADMPEEMRERELPFSQEDLLSLMRASDPLELFLLNTVNSPNWFPLKEERKNLSTGSDGGPPQAE